MTIQMRGESAMSAMPTILEAMRAGQVLKTPASSTYDKPKDDDPGPASPQDGILSPSRPPLSVRRLMKRGNHG